MSAVKTFTFEKKSFQRIKAYHFGKDWPVVYILEGKKEAYIGETVSVYQRSKQHYDNSERSKLDNIHVIADLDYNKSATLDIEAMLIKYISADGKFILQNGNSGLKEHNYYDREKYKAKLKKTIWPALQEKHLVSKSIEEIENSDLFKYSPYKSLTEDQLEIAEEICQNLKDGSQPTHIVSGKPGTGKTILAIYLIKYLSEHKDFKHLNIALVVPMTSLRKTVKQVFKNIKNLKTSMVIGPNDVVKEKYDLLIVDEAHRLVRRKNITNYDAFDKVNKKLGLSDSATSLDWILRSSKNQILFYDKNQSVKPSDVRAKDFEKLNKKFYKLSSQMRVKGGEEYINFIETLFEQKNEKDINFSDYEFKIYDELEIMINDIKEKNKKHGLSRVVAGYAWPWHTKKGSKDYDIDINGLKLIWNSKAIDWVNSPNSINEVGCIHTVQGYDLNYVGVIIGPEISYDKKNDKLIINREKYLDINGRKGVTDINELKEYIINIYKTLLTRGIFGTYVYIVDEDLRNYFQVQIKN
jgi:DUF2075 family protein/DNA replication protein DnaC